MTQPIPVPMPMIFSSCPTCRAPAAYIVEVEHCQGYISPTDEPPAEAPGQPVPYDYDGDTDRHEQVPATDPTTGARRLVCSECGSAYDNQPDIDALNAKATAWLRERIQACTRSYESMAGMVASRTGAAGVAAADRQAVVWPIYLRNNYTIALNTINPGRADGAPGLLDSDCEHSYHRSAASPARDPWSAKGESLGRCRAGYPACSCALTLTQGVETWRLQSPQ